MFKAKSYFYGLISLMFALAVLQGCTRKTESALLSVSIPRYDSRSSKNEVGALAFTTKPTRVMINITGPGIAVPIVYIWEMNRDSNSVGQEPPATVELGFKILWWRRENQKQSRGAINFIKQIFHWNNCASGFGSRAIKILLHFGNTNTRFGN